MAKTRIRNEETRAEMLPTVALAERWAQLLNEKRNEPNSDVRERQFQFACGWLSALVDAELISANIVPELRELLISARPF